MHVNEKNTSTKRRKECKYDVWMQHLVKKKVTNKKEKRKWKTKDLKGNPRHMTTDHSYTTFPR